MHTLFLRMLVLLALCGAVALWCDCAPTSPINIEPDEELGYMFIPSYADLDTAFVGGVAASSVVQLRNTSRNSLKLTNLEGDCPSGTTWSISNPTVSGGGSVDLSLQFSPMQAYVQDYCILSPRFEGYPTAGSKGLTIHFAAGEAACSLSPDGPFDFGSVEVGSSADHTLTISNTTSEDISANQFEYVFQNPSPGCGVFLLEEADSKGILGPGASKNITLRFQPDAVGTFQCQRDLVSRSLAGIATHPNLTNSCPTEITWGGTGVVPSSQWSPCQPSGSTNWSGIFGFSESEVFMVGDGESLFQSAGDCQWAQVGTIPSEVANVNFTDLWGHSDGTERVVYAVGNIPPEPGFFSETGAIVKWDGVDWAVVDRDGLHTYSSVWGSSLGNVYFGGAGVATDFPNAKHWDGNLLNPFQISDMGMSNVIAMSGTGPSEIWAVMDQNFNSVYRFNGTQWENKTPPFPTQPLHDVGLYTTTLEVEVIAVGQEGAIYHYDGSDWEDVSISGESRDFNAVWVSPNGRIFVVGEDRALYLGHVSDPTEWTATTPPPGDPTADFLDVWGPSDDDIYLTATDGEVFRLTAGG